jgi:hypothetical protein
MWTLIVSGFFAVLAIVFSLGKSSSQREEMASKHREELLARKDRNPLNNSKKISK